jgi:hypothetical protein
MEVVTLRGSRRRFLRRSAIALCLVLATAFAQAAERSVLTMAPPSEPIAVGAPARFRIHGRVTGLYPGARKPLRLTLRNPNPFAIRVTKVRTTVQVRGGSSCPPKSVKVQRFAGSRRIPASGVARMRVKVRMRANAPTVCSGQRYRLVYRGWARRA